MVISVQNPRYFGGWNERTLSLKLVTNTLTHTTKKKIGQVWRYTTCNPSTINLGRKLSHSRKILSSKPAHDIWESNKQTTTKTGRLKLTHLSNAFILKLGRVTNAHKILFHYHYHYKTSSYFVSLASLELAT